MCAGVATWVVNAVPTGLSSASNQISHRQQPQVVLLHVHPIDHPNDNDRESKTISTHKEDLTGIGIRIECMYVYPILSTPYIARAALEVNM